MTTVGTRLFSWVLGHRGWVVGALVLATVAMGAGMLRLSFDNSYEIWFVEGDPALVAYDEFIDLFGSDEALIVLVEAKEDPFAEADLRTISEMSTAFEKLEGVHDVWSLTHMEALTDVGGGLETRRLIGEIPAPQEQITNARGLIDNSPLYRPLIGKDGKSASILIHLEHTEGSFDPKARLVREVRRLSAELSGGRPHWITGGAAFDEAIYRHSEQDTLKYTPLMLLVIAATLGWLFRSVAAVLLPFLVVILSNIWALGFMGWVGWQANILTTILPPILAAVGIADSVHLQQQVRLQARRGKSRADAVRSAFIHVLRPCLLTSLTTAAGMLSLLAASLRAMREFGVSVAVGVIAAFLLTIFALPLLMLLVPEKWLGGMIGPGDDPSPQWLRGWVDFSLNHRKVIAALSVVAVVVSGFGMARLTVGASMVTYFYDDDPVFVESLVVDEALGGSYPYEVLIRANEGDDLLDPEDLAAIDAISDYLATVPATGRPFSGVDFLKEARRVLLGEPPSKLALPASRQEAAQILLLLEGDGDITRFLTDDHRSARIETPIKAGAYEKVTQASAEIERRISEIAGGRFHAEVTGLSRLMGAVEEYLVDSQIRSFALAFMLVIGFIAVFFRSLRAGLLSAIPNLLPLVVTIGVMGWIGVRLDLTTVLLAPLLLGIVVDDTVHVMERVLGARQAGATVEDAFRESVVEVGHAVVLTSIILACGFLIPIFGSFKPNLAFALLSVLAISLALVADLIVFPAISSLWPSLVPGVAPNLSPSNSDRYARSDAS